MADHRREESLNNNGEDEMSTAGSSGDVSRSTARSGGGCGGGLAERLNEILMAEGGGGGDLLMQQSVRESNFLQWLQALDLQVMGACRADERLKPLLKVNGGSAADAAEDRLLAHLSQHFEAAEVGLLARCLCVPLVSMRVGKVIKQGSLLCPTSMRGTLNLTLLPSSGLRLSFVGDDGQTERLATINDGSECSAVILEEIPSDQSGRSFLVKPPGHDTFYFWCSEKSKLLGIDLLYKMKDLLERRPTLAELSGISESRLESFAAHLRAYLVGPTVNILQSSAAVSSISWTESNQVPMDPSHSLTTSARHMRARLNGGPVFKGHPQYQGSLSPRCSSFKDGLPKTLASLRSTSREKLRRRGDLYLTTVDNSFVTETVNVSDKGKLSEASINTSSCPLSFLESLGKCNIPSSPSGTSQFPAVSSLFSPCYCWCPPCTSPCVAPIADFPGSLGESLSLPPLSTLLPATVNSSLLTPMPPFDMSCGSPLEFPALLSDPLARMPFPTQSSAPVPAFIPLMCDPIVHIPVLDVCSLGQGYLVSAGPAIATSIPQLHPKLVGPMMSESESLLEQGARETLRLLIGNSSGLPSSSLMGVLPAVLGNEDNKGVVTGSRGFYSGISDVVTGSRGLYSGISDVVTGSRGLYSGINDVDVIVSSFAAVGLNSASERSGIITSLMSCSTAASSDAPEQTSYGLDLQNSTFTSGEDKKD